MNDTFLMCFSQPPSDLDGNLQRFALIQGSLGYFLLQALPFDILHDDKELILFLADFMDVADVIMGEGGSSFRLPHKSLLGLGIRRQLRREKFQGHGAFKLSVLRFVNNSHSSSSDRLDDAIFPRQKTASDDSLRRLLDGYSLGDSDLLGAAKGCRAVSAEPCRVSIISMTFRALGGHC